MGLCECSKCWDTPCTCGWDYLEWPLDELHKQIVMLKGVMQYKKDTPSCNFLEYMADFKKAYYAKNSHPPRSTF